MLFATITICILLAALAITVRNEHAIVQNEHLVQRMFEVHKQIVQNNQTWTDDFSKLPTIPDLSFVATDNELNFVWEQTPGFIEHKQFKINPEFSAKLTQRSLSGGACLVAPWKMNRDNALQTVLIYAFYLPETQNHILMVNY